MVAGEHRRYAAASMTVSTAGAGAALRISPTVDTEATITAARAQADFVLRSALTAHGDSIDCAAGRIARGLMMYRLLCS
jgi:hypothetical protein